MLLLRTNAIQLPFSDEALRRDTSHARNESRASEENRNPPSSAVVDRIAPNRSVRCRDRDKSANLSHQLGRFNCDPGA